MRQVLIQEWGAIHRLSAHPVAFCEICGLRVHAKDVDRYDCEAEETTDEKRCEAGFAGSGGVNKVL